MNMSTELVYCNDLCSAFLTAIVEAFEAHHPRAYLGRTAIQKLTYFVKEVGVPVPCSFGIYTHGPYSDKVAFAIDSLLADDVIENRSDNPACSDYRLGRCSEQLLSEFASSVHPYEDQINRVVKALGAFPPNALELISTLHFIARLQVQIGRNCSKQSVIREFKSVKHDKFSDPDISNCFDALVQAGIIEFGALEARSGH